MASVDCRWATRRLLFALSHQPELALGSVAADHVGSLCVTPPCATAGLPCLTCACQLAGSLLALPACMRALWRVLLVADRRVYV